MNPRTSWRRAPSQADLLSGVCVCVVALQVGCASVSPSVSSGRGEQAPMAEPGSQAASTESAELGETRWLEGEELAESRATLCELDDACCGLDGDESPRSVGAVRISSETTILFLQCSTFGYNRTYSVFTQLSEGRPRPASFAPWPTGYQWEMFQPGDQEVPGNWVMSAYYDRGLHSVYCGRGLCDSGSAVEYAWRDGQFHLARLRSRSDECCANIETGSWPILWPPSERCGYRWELREGELAFVAIARDEPERIVRLGPASECRTHANDTVLDCAAGSFPVTADGSDWILWNAYDSIRESEAPSVRLRVPRGCNL